MKALLTNLLVVKSVALLKKKIMNVRLKQETNYWYRAGECKNVSLIYECTYANTLLEIEDPWGKVTFPFCTSLSFVILMIYRLKGALHDGRVLQLQPMRGVEHKPRCRRHCVRSSLSQRNKVSESSTFFHPTNV